MIRGPVRELGVVARVSRVRYHRAPSASTLRATEETPRVEPAGRQVLREPGRRLEPDGHAPPAPPAAQADRHATATCAVARSSSHGTGWVERIVVDADDISTYFTPLAITLNIDSFEHLEFETRPDQLLVYTLVQGDERVVVEFAPIGPASEDDSPFAPRQLEFDTSELRPDGAARPRSPRGRVADPEAGRPRAGSSREAADREGRSAVRAARSEPAPGSGAQRRGQGGMDPVTLKRSPARRHRRVGGAIAELLQVRRTRHEPRHRGEGRPDHVHGHGLHPVREPGHPVEHVRRAGSPEARRSSRPPRRPRRWSPASLTIAMGVVANTPLALAAGLGINGAVAFGLVLTQGLTPAGAMGVIVLEGIVVTLLVLVGLREAIMRAVPLSLKRAIGVGIGLFILFIGFIDAGIIVKTGGTSAENPVPVEFVFPTTPGPVPVLVRPR